MKQKLYDVVKHYRGSSQCKIIGTYEEDTAKEIAIEANKDCATQNYYYRVYENRVQLKP